MQTIDEIRAAEKASQARWEREAVVSANGWTIADLRTAFEKVESPDGWKLPWTATVPIADMAITYAAVEFYHARPPQIGDVDPEAGLVRMSGRGYQA